MAVVDVVTIQASDEGCTEKAAKGKIYCRVLKFKVWTFGMWARERERDRWGRRRRGRLMMHTRGLDQCEGF